MADTNFGQDNNRFIITGGPGSGKTSLVNALQKLGYTCFPEIARDLIEKGLIPPVRASRPDSGRFFEMILQGRISDHQAVKSGEIAFYDRGIPDSLAFFRFLKCRPPLVLLNAVDRYRYNTVVFAAPPWKDIYQNDIVRQESFSEALELYHQTVEAYTFAGYQLVELPKGSVEERARICSAALR